MLRLTSVAVSDGLIGRRLVARPKHRRVPALRQVDDQFVAMALFAVIARQPRAQAARLHAHDRVGARIERRFLAEHLDADHVFLELAAAAGDGLERR